MEARIVFSDDKGELRIDCAEGKRILTAKDPKGLLLFSGPVETREEIDKIPAEVRDRFEKLQQKDLPSVVGPDENDEDDNSADADDEDDDPDDEQLPEPEAPESPPVRTPPVVKAVRDAVAAQAPRFEGVFVIRPPHNPVGPFDFGGAFDERSDRFQRIDELMDRGYEDAYRQFIEPVVGA